MLRVLHRNTVLCSTHTHTQNLSSQTNSCAISAILCHFEEHQSLMVDFLSKRNASVSTFFFFFIPFLKGLNSGHLLSPPFTLKGQPVIMAWIEGQIQLFILQIVLFCRLCCCADSSLEGSSQQEQKKPCAHGTAKESNLLTSKTKQGMQMHFDCYFTHNMHIYTHT